VVVGSSPGGVISLISASYGGSISDRQLVERMSLGSVCDAGDSIMADKGFNIQDLLACSGKYSNIFEKKESILSEDAG